MRKIIQGHLYNTETAKKCGEYEPNPYQSDFHWYRETLYQKKNGEFFLHGEGNAASPYCTAISQNEWSSGEKIIPLTFGGAAKWAEEYLDADEYSAIFGEPDEGGTDQARLHCRVSASAFAKLKRIQQETGATIGEIVEKLVSEA